MVKKVINNDYNSNYQRIREIIKKFDYRSTADFALRIGILKQNLYQIRDGKQGITVRIAEFIRKKHPEISLQWLVTGDGDMIDTNLLREPPGKYMRCPDCQLKDMTIRQLHEDIRKLKHELEDCKDKLDPEEKRKVG